MTQLPRIVVVGLGPGGPDLVTAGAMAAIDAADHRYLRTTQHPAASLLGDAPSFDDVYDAAETFADVYVEIVERLVAAATEHGEVLYAVPGSPLVLERTCDLLRADDRIELELIPGLSFIDLAWVRLGIDPLEDGVRLVDGHLFAEKAAGERGPLLIAHTHAKSILSDIKLAVEIEPDQSVTVLHHLGLPDESLQQVPWADLDRSFEPDHLTSLYVPQLAEPVAAEFARFGEMVSTLREQCPWDAEQTHASLRRHLLEETYETIEAIDNIDVETGEGYEHLEEELGDLLYQIFFHSVLAREQGQFTVADVARGIHDKLYVRHPHVYGDASAEDSDEVLANWEQQKKIEKGRTSVMEGIPVALPALLYALKVQKKAASLGFGLPDLAAAFADVDDELAEVREDPSEAEVGDLIFAAVQVARQLKHDPEMALRAAADRFRTRFEHVEATETDLAAASFAELQALWAEAKRHVG